MVVGVCFGGGFIDRSGQAQCPGCGGGWGCDCHARVALAEGAGDEDDATEGDEAGQELFSGKGLAGDEERAGVAGDYRGEEGYHGCFGEGEVLHGVVEGVDACEAEEGAEEEETADGACAEWGRCRGDVHV